MPSLKQPVQTSKVRLCQLLGGLLTLIFIAGCGSSTITAKSLIRISVDGFEATDNGSYQAYKATQAALIKSKFVLRAALRDPEIAQLPTLQSKPKPIKWLEKNIKTRFEDDSEILAVSLQCNSADEATSIVDAVVAAYMEEVAHARRNEISTKLEELRCAERDVKQKLKDTMTTANRHAAEIGDPFSPLAKLNQKLVLEETASLERRISELRSTCTDAKIQLYVAASRAKLEASPSPESLIKSDGERMTDQARLTVLMNEMQEYKTEKFDAYQKLRDLTGFSPALEMEKQEISSLKNRMTAISVQIQEVELRMSERRIICVQSALTDEDELDY